MKHSVFAFSILLILFSCSQEIEEQNESTRIDLSNIFEKSQSENIFKDVRYLKLETTDDNLLGDKLYFYTEEDKIYILDRTHQNALLTFNNQGEFMGKAGKRGKGPREYPNTLDFIIRNDTVDFLTSAGANYSIYSYLLNGSFIKKTDINFYAHSFQLLENKYYAISTNFQKSYHDHQIYLLNKKGEEVKKLHPNNTRLDMSIGENCFTTFKNKVYYFEPFNNKVYELHSDTIFPVFELNFGKYNIPQSFFEMDIMKGFELINKRGFSMIKNVFVNKEKVVFEITQQTEKGGKLYVITYDKKSGEIKSLALNEENLIFRYPIGLNDKNEMMYLVFPMGDVIKEFEKHGLELNISDFKESDNPVVVYCKIK